MLNTCWGSDQTNERKDAESLNQGSSHGAKKERLLVFVLLQNSNVDGEWQILVKLSINVCEI